MNLNIDSKGLQGRLVIENIKSTEILYPRRYCIVSIIFFQLVFTFTMLHAQVPDTVTIAIHRGWNLISVPLVVPDNNISILFPNARSTAFSYHHGYVSEEQIIPRRGYWIKFDTSEIITIVGVCTPEPCISLEKGWNLVGLFSRDIPKQIIYTEPRENLESGFYGFNSQGYYLTDTIKPGLGYWVKAKNTGGLTAIGGSNNWELVSTMQLPALAFDASDSNVIYAGLNSDFGTGFHGMILKSINKGVTWDTLKTNLDVFSLMSDPVDPKIMYASCGTSNGDTPQILKTTDGGKSWVRADNGIYFDWETAACVQAINPLDHNILYAATGGFYGGIPYKSTNGGYSWNPIIRFDMLNCPHDTLCYIASSEISLNPQNPNTVYAYNTFSRLSFFLESFNASETWEVDYDLPIHDRQTLTLRVLNPYDTNIVYVSNDSGFYKSINGGIEWKRIDSTLPVTGWVGSIVFTSEINTFYILHFNDHKIYQTIDGGTTWFPLGINDVWRLQQDSFGSLYAFRLDGFYRLKYCFK